MVLGQGTIFNRFISYQLQSTHIIFAGNIHNSQITDESQLKKEEDSLKSALAQKTNAMFIYFSSTSVTEPEQTTYIKHKLQMEKIILETSKNYLIFRLPQLIGFGDESSSFINYLITHILNGKSFQLWENATRNFIDIDDVFFIVHEILLQANKKNKIINIANPSNTSVADACKTIENFFGKKANCSLISKGTQSNINISEINDILNKLKLDFNSNYLEHCLNKYYNHLRNPPQTISIVVPTYNEELGIAEFYRRTKTVLNLLVPAFDHEFLFVNDFSTDQTLANLRKIAAMDPSVKIINFSRNFGNQIAITAGIDNCIGDIAVIIDDDLQDPPEIILDFLALWNKGHKVVYGVRPKRQGVNLLFKLIAKTYYRIIGQLSDVAIPKDTGDFRLIDRTIIDRLKEMREENRYYRGMVAWVGFSQIGWIYNRDKRYAGTSTFSLKKYINFAFNGITSFSEKPLLFANFAGFFIALVGFILLITLVLSKLFDPTFSIRGWTSIIAIFIFFGGIQLLSIGIVGIYISKIYREVKNRPLYIVESTTNMSDTSIKSNKSHRGENLTYNNLNF